MRLWRSGYHLRGIIKFAYRARETTLLQKETGCYEKGEKTTRGNCTLRRMGCNTLYKVYAKKTRRCPYTNCSPLTTSYYYYYFRTSLLPLKIRQLQHISIKKFFNFQQVVSGWDTVTKHSMWGWGKSHTPPSITLDENLGNFTSTAIIGGNTIILFVSIPNLTYTVIHGLNHVSLGTSNQSIKCE